MVGAAALSLGVCSRIPAVALALFVDFVSLAFVQFRSIERPADARVIVRNLFIGNVAIVGWTALRRRGRRRPACAPRHLATRTGGPRCGKRSTQSNQGQKATAIKGKTAKRPCLTLA
jgi:hypothetical protein